VVTASSEPASIPAQGLDYGTRVSLPIVAPASRRLSRGHPALAPKPKANPPAQPSLDSPQRTGLPDEIPLRLAKDDRNTRAARNFLERA